MNAPKTTHPVVRAALGIVAMVLVAMLANWLISLTSFGTRGADFTEDKVHTLSKGTKSILSKLDAPVTIRYYASRKSDAMPRESKLFVSRIDDILKEYVNLAADGKLRVENLDPQPDTDAEDSANLDGVQSQQINQYENVTLGLAVSCLDQTSTININPFETQTLDEQEMMFEYNLSRAISEVSAVEKPVIGIMSALSMKPAPMMMPGQPQQPGWFIYQQLSQYFQVKDVEMTATEIPDDVKVLLLIHPAGISPETEFVIDQFVLKGGTLIACLDAYSYDAASSGGGNPMMGGGGGIAPSSTLPTLLPAWNIEFESTQTIADATYRSMLQGGRPGYSILSLPKSSMPDQEDIITKNLNDLFFVLPGGITNKGGNGLASSTLVKTSIQAGLVDPMAASQLSPNMVFKDRRSYDLVLRLTGNFKSAFPNGKPSSEASENKPASLKEAEKPGTVYLIADTDAFSNQGAYRAMNFGGMQQVAPYNGNSVLLMNIIDQAASSSDLIGSRSRASIRRPFTLINEMEEKANAEVSDKVEKLREKEKEAISRLSALQSSKSNSRDLYASPEQEAEIKKLREQQVDAGRQIRDLQKDLKSNKDALTAKITAWNLFAIPSAILAAGFSVWGARRRSSRAR